MSWKWGRICSSLSWFERRFTIFHYYEVWKWRWAKKLRFKFDRTGKFKLKYPTWSNENRFCWKITDPLVSHFSSKPDKFEFCNMSKEQEHPIKWLKSKAWELLLKDLFDGVVPLNAKDENNKTTMPLKTIYKMRPEFQKYLYKNFLCRLASLREIVKKMFNRARDDKKVSNTFCDNHEVPLFSKSGGYMQ